MIEGDFLQDSQLQLQKLKSSADRAIAQLDSEQLFAVLDPGTNSIAVIMKHMSGNMRSRWTGFLDTDGEKSDRDRDREFVIEPWDTWDRVLASWEAGWSRVFGAVSTLTVDDLTRTVRIRGEAHSVLEAINRQIAHYAAHVGQIILLAKHYAGPNWETLSIPRGRSKEFDVSKGGNPYRVQGIDDARG